MHRWNVRTPIRCLPAMAGEMSGPVLGSGVPPVGRNWPLVEALEVVTARSPVDGVAAQS